MATEYVLDASTMYTDEAGVVSNGDQDLEQAQTATPKWRFSDIDVPNQVVRGGTITVSGTLAVDCAIDLFGQDTRVRIQSSEFGETVIDTGPMGCGDRVSFEQTYEAPQSAGQTVNFTIQLEHDPLGPWTTADTATRSVDIVTESTKTVTRLTKYAPWAGVGGVAGYYGGRELGYDPMTAGAAGAALGTGARFYTGGIGQLNESINFPTESAYATAAVLGAGAALVWGGAMLLPEE